MSGHFPLYESDHLSGCENPTTYGPTNRGAEKDKEVQSSAPKNLTKQTQGAWLFFLSRIFMAAEKLRFFHLQAWGIEKYVEIVEHIYIYIQHIYKAKMSQNVVLVMPYRFSFIGVVIKWEPFFGIGVGVGSRWVLGKDCMVFHVSHVELGVPKLVKWHLFSLLTNKKGGIFLP